MEYISRILSSRIKGGLVDTLYKRKLAVTFESGVQQYSQSIYGVLFAIKMELTQLGMSDQNQVFGLVFAYLSVIKQRGVKEEIFENQKQVLMSKLNAETVGRSAVDNVLLVAKSIPRYHPEDVLLGSTQLFEFDPKSILQVLKAMTTHTVNIMLVSQDFGQQVFPSTVENTDCQYRKIATSAARRRYWNNNFIGMQDDFMLPTEMNPFFTNFTTFKPTNPLSKLSKSHLDSCDGVSSKWTMLRLKLPMSRFYCEIYGHVGSNLAMSRGVMEIFCKASSLVMDTMLGDGTEVGMSTAIHCTLHGSIAVTVTGFDDQAESMFTKILRAIMDRDSIIDETAAFFVPVKEHLLKQYDSVLNSPKTYASYLLGQAVLIGCPSVQDVQSAMCELEIDDFREFLAQYFARPTAELEIVGNANRVRAQRVTGQVCRLGFQGALYPAGQLPRRLALLALPVSRHIWQVYSPRQTNPIPHLKLYIPLDGASLKELSIAECLIWALYPEFNEFIRHRPFGYDCDVRMTRINDIYSIQFDVTYDQEVNKDDMIFHLDTFLKKFYEQNIKHTNMDKLRKWTKKAPVLEKLEEFTVEDLKKFVKDHLKPGIEISFRGIYIQVVPQENKKEEEKITCWDDYRRPRPVHVVNQSKRGKKTKTTYYISDVKAFQARGHGLP